MSAAAGNRGRVLLDAVIGLKGLSVDPRGERLLVGESSGDVWLVPLDGGERRLLEGIERRATSTALDPRGRFAAAGSQDLPFLSAGSSLNKGGPYRS